MIIKTNNFGFASARKMLYSVDILLIADAKSVFQLATEDPIPNVIITENTSEASRAMERFPEIKFFAPGLSFPGYSFNYVQGYDPIQLKVLAAKELYGANCVLFNRRRDNMIFVKKLESLFSLKVFGNGHGLPTCGPIPQEYTPALYKADVLCAANEIEEIIKINALGKTAITPFDFDDCVNVFRLEDNSINFPSVNPNKYKEYEWDKVLLDAKILSETQYKKMQEWKKKILESGP
jgi:hypothetical protein